MPRVTMILAACIILSPFPVAASTEALEAQVEQINELYDRAFSMPTEQRETARNIFLEIASLAEAALEEMDGLDDASVRDLRRQAANAYYYAAEHEHWMAKEAEDPSLLTTQKVDHLEKALALHSQVFAEGVAGMLVAEYYFGSSLLVEYGLQTNDPRTGGWAKANVHAARLRIEESGMLGIDPPTGAKVELINALLDYAEAVDDSSVVVEAKNLFDTVPENRRSYSLRKRLREKGLIPE